MKKHITLLTLSFIFFSGIISTAQAQISTITYSQQFQQGVGSSGAQCTAYNTFKSQLASNLPYICMTIRGTFDQAGITCADPNSVLQMANALRNGSTVSITCNGQVWHLCSRYQGEFWLNPPSSCSGANCPFGYIIRPCIGGTNPNWGGVNTATCGAPSQTMELIFTYGSVVAPQASDTIVGPTAVCVGDTVNYTVDTVGATGGNYNWTLPAGWNIISGSGTNAISATVGTGSGSVIVDGGTGCIQVDIDSISVNVNPLLSLSGQSISGNNTACQGDTLIYTVTAVPDANSYSWMVPAGASIVSGAGTNSIAVAIGNSSGTISVSAMNACDSVFVDSVSLAVTGMPGPASLQGPGSVCYGDTITLIPSITGTVDSFSYAQSSNWTLNSNAQTGTIEIIFTGGTGSLIMSGSNSCFTQALDTISIQVDSLPAPPAMVSGPDTVCWGDTIVFTADTVSGASGYNWNLPQGATIISGQGTASITVVMGGVSGTVSVNAQNGCGVGSDATTDISVDSCLVGIFAPPVQDLFTLSPNPTNGEVRIRMSRSLNQPVTLWVISSEGRLVRKNSWNQLSAGEDITEQLSNEPNGIYFFRLSDGERSQTVKVVLMN